MNIKISRVSYSWIGEISGQVSGNYHYDIFERGINFSGYIDENSMVIEAERDEVFTFELDEETLKKILEFKNITINGTWENKSKKFPCVINSISPLGGKLSEIYKYNISGEASYYYRDDDWESKFEYDGDALYSPSMNVSYFSETFYTFYFDTNVDKIDIKAFKDVMKGNFKKSISDNKNEESGGSSISHYDSNDFRIGYFDNKILCIEEYVDWFGGGAHGDDWYNYTIISLETGKKLNNDFLKDLVDYNEENEEFKEFLKKEFIEYHKDITEANKRFDIFYFSYSTTSFIFNNDGTIDIYNDWFPYVSRVFREVKK